MTLAPEVISSCNPSQLGVAFGGIFVQAPAAQWENSKKCPVPAAPVAGTPRAPVPGRRRSNRKKKSWMRKRLSRLLEGPGLGHQALGLQAAVRPWMMLTFRHQRQLGVCEVGNDPERPLLPIRQFVSQFPSAAERGC